MPPQDPQPNHAAPGSAEPPTPKPRVTLCPYCGARTRSVSACEVCAGRFDPLSRQATQNAMGPWFVRDESQPFRPGCSYATMLRLIERGTLSADTPVRGPSTRQFWTPARWCPGIAHRLGVCHSCQTRVEPDDEACPTCGASFVVPPDRQHLGLGEIRALPGRAAESARPPRPAAAESAPADSPHEVPGPAMPAADLDEIRTNRLQRELRRSRRWTLVWSLAACLLALAVGGYLVARTLDLDTGPVGRWLAAGSERDAAPPPQAQPTPAIPAGQAEPPPENAAAAPGIGETEAEGAVEDQAGDGESPPDSEPASPPPDASDGDRAVNSGETARRLRRIEALRRLR